MRRVLVPIAVLLVAAGCRSGIEPAAKLSLSQTLKPYQTSVLALAYSPNGAHLASAHRYMGHPGTRSSFLVDPPVVRIWGLTPYDEANAKFQVKNKLGYHRLQFSPDGKTLSVVADTELLFWDVENQTLRQRPIERPAAISPDLRLIADSDEERGISIMNVADLSVRQTLDVRNTYVDEISPDGSLIAVHHSSNDETCYDVWNLDSGRRQIRLETHESTPRWSHFSPDGHKVVTRNDHHVFVWDVRTGEQRAQLGPHAGTIWSVEFSPDSRTVAVGSGYEVKKKWVGAIDLWDIDSGSQLGSVIDKSTWGITALAFSPDATNLASGDGDGQIKIWNLSELNTGRDQRDEQ